MIVSSDVAIQWYNLYSYNSPINQEPIFSRNFIQTVKFMQFSSIIHFLLIL